MGTRADDDGSEAGMTARDYRRLFDAATLYAWFGLVVVPAAVISLALLLVLMAFDRDEQKNPVLTVLDNVIQRWHEWRLHQREVREGAAIDIVTRVRALDPDQR